MTRTRVNKSDMKATGIASGLALIADGTGDIVHGYSTPATHTHTESQITDLSHDAIKLQSRDISSTAPVSGQALAWNSLQWVPSGVIGAGGDTDTKQVKATITDTTEGYLQTKIRAGSNVSIALISGGANEFLQVSATVSGAGTDTKKVMVSSTDTTENYLESKLSAGSNVTITKLYAGSDEQLQIASTGGAASGVDVLQVQVFS